MRDLNIPNNSIGVDYTTANDLEYSLHKQTLMKKIRKRMEKKSYCRK